MKAVGSAFVLMSVVVHLCLPTSVFAHPDVSHPAGELRDDYSGHVLLSIEQTDGLVFADPRRLQVHDAQGRLLGETDFGRDLVLLCWFEKRCVAFVYAGFLGLYPSEAWLVSTRGLTELETLSLLLPVALIAPLFVDGPYYLIAALSLLLPLLLLHLVRSSRIRAIHVAGLAALGLVMPFYAIVWLFLVVAQLPLLPHLVAIVTGLIALVWQRWAEVRAFVERFRVRATGPAS